MTSASFTGNIAVRAGGAIALRSGADLEVDGSTFSQNRAEAAPGNGGAIHVTGADSDVDIAGPPSPKTLQPVKAARSGTMLARSCASP